jgi:transposase-like protein
MPCIRCKSERTRRDGHTRLGGQRWRCNDCHRRCTARSTSAFTRWVPGHGFPNDVIAVAVRWYVRFRLSYADVVEWFAERGLMVERSTIYRWVQRFLPLFGEAARAHRAPVGPPTRRRSGRTTTGRTPIHVSL